MGSRHSHRLVIISHDLAQKLRPGKDRDGPSRCGCIFRVVGMDCGRIDHHVGPFHNILRFLSVKELCSVGLQLLCELRLPGVGTGYGKSPFQQDLRQTAHTDPANADKMHMAGTFKIYMIHVSAPLGIFTFIIAHKKQKIHRIQALDPRSSGRFCRQEPPLSRGGCLLALKQLLPVWFQRPQKKLAQDPNGQDLPGTHGDHHEPYHVPRAIGVF